MTGLTPVEPLGKQVRAPLDLIELDAFGQRISLTDLHDALVDFTPRLERAVEVGYQAHGEIAKQTLGSDLMVEFQVEFSPDVGTEE